MVTHRQCGLTKKAEPPPTRDVNRDSGTTSDNGGWLRRLVRPLVNKQKRHENHNRPRNFGSDEPGSRNAAQAARTVSASSLGSHESEINQRTASGRGGTGTVLPLAVLRVNRNANIQPCISRNFKNQSSAGVIIIHFPVSAQCSQMSSKRRWCLDNRLPKLSASLGKSSGLDFLPVSTDRRISSAISLQVGGSII